MIDPLLIESSEKFVKWFQEAALPLWSSRGIDQASGASYERFLADGSVDLQVKPRVRVQARQIFTFCKAQELGWMNNAAPVVDGLVKVAEGKGKHSSGIGFGHLWSPQYELIEPQLDLYNHAFWLLASASRYKTFNDDTALQQAEKIIAMLDAKFGGVSGGWREGNYEAPCRRQNPHMHLFEAFMTLYEVSGSASWLARAGEVFSLFESCFFDANFGVLREFFDDDWQVLLGEKGDVIEPGHMMEWVWLLRWYERLTGRNVDFYANTLFEVGLKLGLSETGLLYDGVSPTGEIIHATKRCWPQIELIKACIVEARAGNKDAEALAGKSLHLLLDKYVNSPVRGLYIDQLDQNDEVCVDVAPASTLYHLIVAAYEVRDYLVSM